MSAALRVVDDDASTDDLQARAAAARAEIQRLTEAAQLAVRELDEARFAFTKAPTEKLALRKIVCEQRSTNARVALDTYAADVAPLLRDAMRDQALRDLDAIRSEADPTTAFRAEVARIDDLCAEFDRQIRGAILALHERLEHVNETRRKATQLAGLAGTDEKFTLIEFASLREQIVGGSQFGIGPRPIDVYVGERPDSYRVVVAGFWRPQ